MSLKIFKNKCGFSLIKIVTFSIFISLFTSGCQQEKKIVFDKSDGKYYYEPNEELRYKSDYNKWDFSIKNPNETVLKKIIFVGRKHCKNDGDLINYKANEVENEVLAYQPKYYNQNINYYCGNGRTILVPGGDVKHYIMTSEEIEYTILFNENN